MDSNVPPIQPPTPPPIIVTQPPRRRGGGGWMILSILLLGLLGLMMFGSVVSFFIGEQTMTGTQSGRFFEEITVENPGAPDKIAIVDVRGMITSEPWNPDGRGMVDLIADQLRVAAEDTQVRAVILQVDSPGGEVMASDDISRAIFDFQEEHDKPVIALMGGLAASGGYYISAPCRWIIANELTLTGSIGVIMQTFNYRGLMDKVGLQPVVFKSGRFKDMLRGSKSPEEIDPEAREMVQEMVMETFAKFKEVVKDGRARAAAANDGEGRELVEDWEQYADGRILTGRKAYELGFVDELGNFETAVETTKRIAGITGDAHLVRYREPFTLARLFGMGMKSEEKTIKIDMGMDLPKLQTGRLYFLSPTVVH